MHYFCNFSYKICVPQVCEKHTDCPNFEKCDSTHVCRENLCEDNKGKVSFSLPTKMTTN